MKPRHTLSVRGFSLIELLVSMVIGLIVALAITSVLIRTEGNKRSTTSVNDLNQTGAHIAFVLDRAVRSAGSGFAQNWSSGFGCLLDVSQAADHVLPVSLPASSAFANVNASTMQVRLAPVVIGQGLADADGETRGDVLMVMSGTAGMGESSTAVESVADNVLMLPNKLGYRSKDLILLANDAVPDGCMIQQVGSTTPATGSVDLAGKYYGATGTNVNLSAFASSSIALQLGNEDNPPHFQLFGVGSHHTLFSYDLLRLAAEGPELPVADGVVEMRALYGVDTDATPNGVLDAWAAPAGAEFAAEVLTNGSAAAKASLRKIVAVRVGFILRTSLQERDYSLPGGKVTLFDGVTGADSASLAYTRTFTGIELAYRYRVVEVTIPLRNILLAPQS